MTDLFIVTDTVRVNRAHAQILFQSEVECCVCFLIVPPTLLTSATIHFLQSKHSLITAHTVCINKVVVCVWATLTDIWTILSVITINRPRQQHFTYPYFLLLYKIMFNSRGQYNFISFIHQQIEQRIVKVTSQIFILF